MKKNKLHVLVKMYGKEVALISILALLGRGMAFVMYTNFIAKEVRPEEFVMVIFPFSLQSEELPIGILLFTIHILFILLPYLLSVVLLEINELNFLFWPLLKENRFLRLTIVEFLPSLLFSLCIELITSITLLILLNISIERIICYFIFSCVTAQLLTIISDLVYRVSRIDRKLVCLVIILVSYLAYTLNISRFILHWTPFNLLSVLNQQQITALSVLPTVVIFVVSLLLEYQLKKNMDYIGGE